MCSLFVIMYRLTNFRIVLAFSYARVLFLAMTKMLVLSAKSTTSVLLCAFDRSFMYTRKSNGPRQLPWGTPKITGRWCENSPKKFTYWWYHELHSF